jgi:FixJ family two-component response regulator
MDKKMTDDSMIEEFKIEAQEMFENSEEGFLKIEKGEDFVSNYNLIFRAFHSLKGAAGMFGLERLQGHMHKLESLFEAQKSRGSLDKNQIDYFLSGIDCAKNLLEGNEQDFSYYTLEEFNLLDSKSNEKSVSKPQNIEAPIEKVKTTPQSTSHKRGLFYIVDDEEAILTILKDAITDLGFDVKTFDNAEDLLQNIDEDTPDVVLSDIKMPEMNGIELLHKLRDLGIDTPVIFISGYISKEVMLDALKHGAFAFIEKPFNEMYLNTICENAFTKVQTMKLLQKSINYILYQFSDLDKYLKDQGKESLRQSLKTDLTNILDQQKKLKNLKL